MRPSPQAHIQFRVRRLVVLLLPLIAAGCAATAARTYPDLVNRKHALGKVALAADVVVIQDLPGEAEKIGVDESRRYGDAVLAVVIEGLKAKGYSVGPSCVASVGQALSAAEPYVVVDSVGQPLRADTAITRSPPVYLDPNLRESGAARRWASLVRRLWSTSPRRAGEPASVLHEATELRGPLGGDVALVVTGVGWRSPPRKRHDPMALATAGYAGWHQSIGVLQLAVLDCRTGELLWADARRARRPLTAPALEGMARELVRAMP
jgi:hypothetical protein